MALSDRIQNIPTWAYAVGALFVVGAAFLLTRGSGGQAATSTAIPSADVNDILNQLQDAANQLGGSQSGTTPTNSGSGTGSQTGSGGFTATLLGPPTKTTGIVPQTTSGSGTSRPTTLTRRRVGPLASTSATSLVPSSNNGVR